MRVELKVLNKIEETVIIEIRCIKKLKSSLVLNS